MAGRIFPKYSHKNTKKRKTKRRELHHVQIQVIVVQGTSQHGQHFREPCLRTGPRYRLFVVLGRHGRAAGGLQHGLRHTEHAPHAVRRRRLQRGLRADDRREAERREESGGGGSRLQDHFAAGSHSGRHRHPRRGRLRHRLHESSGDGTRQPACLIDIPHPSAAAAVRHLHLPGGFLRSHPQLPWQICGAIPQPCAVQRHPDHIHRHSLFFQLHAAGLRLPAVLLRHGLRRGHRPDGPPVFHLPP